MLSTHMRDPTVTYYNLRSLDIIIYNKKDAA